jgi:hypothetical protein
MSDGSMGAGHGENVAENFEAILTQSTDPEFGAEERS